MNSPGGSLDGLIISYAPGEGKRLLSFYISPPEGSPPEAMPQERKHGEDEEDDEEYLRAVPGQSSPRFRSRGSRRSER